MIPSIFFWLPVLLLAHSYLLFPLILELLGKKKSPNNICYSPGEQLPFISVIMSVYNEEKVIEEKLNSIYDTSYPADKIEILVGSDLSNDGTDEICKQFEKKYPNFRFHPFTRRQGKPSVINRLSEEARGEILVLTDAKVFLTKDTLSELVKHFKNESIDIVGGNILNKKISADGISRQEKAFMSREIQIKYNEGKIWGKTIGVYGAIYAIRKKSFSRVPTGHSVDDFYITMNVLKNKGKAIMELNAITIEDVPNLLSAEFRRKVRISAGNFQNLADFSGCLLPPWSSLSFAFLSHKVIRWFGPILIISLVMSNLFLLGTSVIYTLSFYLLVFLFLVPVIDLFLRKFNIHVVFLRFITHFLSMNFALLVGFIKQMLGIRTDIWQPTKR